MGQTTKIDWCTASWNPVSGCLKGCEYCYARRIAERFYGGPTPDDKCHVINRLMYDDARNPRVYPFGFAPTLHRYRLHEPMDWKKPKSIFVGSMTDLFADCIPDEWIKTVFKVCERVKQHRYLFLTKCPERYLRLADHGMLPESENFWYGSTVTDDSMPFFHSDHHNCFLSIEPILSDLKAGNLANSGIKWVIIGAETGNRKNRVKPEKAWISHITDVCDQAEVRVFMKESIRELMGNDFRQDFPWRA